MTPQDAETIVAIAALAAQADGQQDAAERTRIAETASGLGLADSSVTGATAMAAAVGDHAALARLVERLSDEAARQAAYDTAASVCYADGWANPSEAAFLRALAGALGIDPSSTDRTAAAYAQTALPTSDAAALADTSGAAAPPSDLDKHILDQAMLAAALELLPDRLANLGILPLQLRLVHSIGASHGQQMNASQVKDLAAAFGIGAAAQIMEKVVRGALGGLAGMLGRGTVGGMLGGLAGNAAGFAAGASVTFATTYALGHAAEQYYVQGRSLSTADMRGLLTRFQTDATTLYPRVEARIRELVRDGNVGSLIRGSPR